MDNQMGNSLLLLYKDLASAGVPFMLFIWVVTLYRGDLVPKRLMDELKAERDWWRTSYLRMNQLHDKALDANLAMAKSASGGGSGVPDF